MSYTELSKSELKMKANKWNYSKHAYDPVDIPDDCSTYSTNMDQIVSCPQCGKKIRFGEGYTSQEIHTAIGMGFTVCEQCHIEEMKRRFKDE